MASYNITTNGFPETDLLATHGYGGIEPDSPGPTSIAVSDIFLFTSELDQSIYISIFSDRRVPFSEEAPSEPNDRRGWWGDLLEINQNTFIGSRLWTLHRSKAIADEITDDIKAIVAESVQWLIDDGVATDITVTVTRLSIGEYQIDVVVIKGDKFLTKFEAVWNRLAAGEY